MKKYADLSSLWRGLRGEDEGPLARNVIDQYHINVLKAYREVAMFVVPVFHFIIHYPLSRLAVSQPHIDVIKEALDECEAVIEDTGIYVVDGEMDEESSRQLEEKVKKFDVAIIHAGNLCNNFPPGALPEELLQVVLRGRNICDATTKRVRI